jgi:hypothetical protein
MPIQRSSVYSAESYIGIAFTIIIPISLFLGSILTGCLAKPIVKKNLLYYILVSPGLYFALFALIQSYFSGYCHINNQNIFIFIIVILISLSGVTVGSALRRTKEEG